MSVTGLDEALARMDAFGQQVRTGAERSVRMAAETARTLAIAKIQRDPKTGVVYVRGGGQNLSPTHQASAPGEAPATDTGNLAGSAHIQSTGLSATLTFGAPYAYWLEYGTLSIAPRPFFEPSVAEAEEWLNQDLRRVLADAEREHNR